MNSDFARLLAPPEYTLEGLRAGRFALNETANRVIETNSGRFVAALVPSPELQQTLSSLPLDPQRAMQSLPAPLQPTLALLQLTSTVGALASVANLGVCCVGFAVVLKRLSRIDGKLDLLLHEVALLRDAVAALHERADALSMARLRAAGANLDAAIRSTTMERRRELASRARDGFQEAKYLHHELWRRSQPWESPDIGVAAVIELQNRFLVCAIGQLQAEFLLADDEAFRHTVRSAVDEFGEMIPDAQHVFAVRTAAVCGTSTPRLAWFGQHMPDLAAELRVAHSVSQWSARRLSAYEQDIELPGLLSAAPHEIMGSIAGAKGSEILCLSNPAHQGVSA